MELLKVDSAIDRQKIEQWTLENTFPDIIIFIPDGKGGFVIGSEVLQNPDFKNIEITDSGSKEKLTDFINRKSVLVIETKIDEQINGEIKK